MVDEKTLATSQMTAITSKPCSEPTQPTDAHAAAPPMTVDESDAINTADTKKTTLEYPQNKENDIVEAGINYGSQKWYHRHATRYSKHIVYATIWILFTGWWITGLILHRFDLGWLIPFLLYLAITLRLIFLYVPISVVTRPVFFVWNQTASRLVSYVPERFRIPGAALVTIAVILVGAFASPETHENTRADRAVSLFGLVVCLFILWLSSRNRKKIVWHTVIVGMLVQFIIALFVLRTKAGYDIFNIISTLARELLGFARQGVDFLIEPEWAEKHSSWFLVGVIPAILFFVSLVQLLYYSSVLQWAIRKFATFFFWCMRVSGAEAVVAAASPFIGQGESAMLIKPFVPFLTMAEVHQIMCSGFATIAGSVLIAYIGMGVNPQALVSSCVMSIPSSLAASKLRWPEEEETLTAGRVVVPDDDEDKPANALHAFANGAWLGLKISGMIAATLLCIISLIGLINGLLTWWGHYLNINNPPLTIELIVGYICYPIAFLLGVSRNGDLLKVGKLIGIKIVMNEFVAYNALQNNPEYQDLSARSRLIATYALCGFANIGALGNQIGVLAQLAPSRSGDVSRVAVSAMLTGAISTLTSAAIAGMLITDEQQFARSSS
ncbi:H+/nucleoside cotransporter [Aspergillus sclerotioniger CBS 115572]|uniref:H+/nucleoside cotransporter n=1 Tax=Aspergillus sclerotioniger CBS 115572 TaxID=1450535 RepID=A0A317X7G3_9EURO|nr:H+/nucleoside cotransporter [Aspergillus sclerotioniger CBS 115572]PWY94479.1 H+/nucleoside cotransporter [Aspergillus sclerotioniger CBS 115572]